MSRSLSAPSSPEMEKSGPSSPRTSPKAYRSSPLAPARPSGISVTAPTPDPDRFGVDGDDDEDDGARSPLDVSATSVISPSVSLSSLTTVPYTSPSPMHSYARSVSGANEFYGLGRAANETMESVLRDEVGRWAGGGTRRPSSYAHRRVSSLAHGAPPRTSSTGPPPSASASSETETLLWTFAKLEAHFEVDGRLIKPHEFLSVKRALFSGVGGGSGPGFGMVGGGTLGGAATSNGTAQKGGWRGWLFGSGGDPPAAADHAQPDAGSATVSMAQEGGAGEEEGMGGSLEARRARAMKDSAVPMFSTPPSVVAVDMKLAPGESKTCGSSPLVSEASQGADPSAVRIPQTPSRSAYRRTCRRASKVGPSSSSTASSSAPTVPARRGSPGRPRSRSAGSCASPSASTTTSPVRRSEDFPAGRS